MKHASIVLLASNLRSWASPLKRLSVCVLSVALFATQASALEAEGRAFDPKKQTLLYIEKHFFPSPLAHEVRYYEPDGTLFTEKRLDYSASQIAPSFEQLNQRQGEKIRVSNTDKIRLTYQANYEAKTEQASFTQSSSLVVDAGFVRYVTENWSDLLEGKTHTVTYLVPSRQATVKFEVKRRQCELRSESGDACFEVEPKTWWLSLLIDPLYLAYNLDTKRLSRFVGRGNIADKKGKYQKVDIRYKYIE